MYMRKIIKLNLLVAICAILAINGCASMQPRGEGESGNLRVQNSLNVAGTLRFEDVPTPALFSNLRDQSFVFQDGATRVGFMRYSGRPNADQVISFFKTQMPLYNWDIINIVEYGNITMSFVKSSESCMITVTPLATKTIISIVVSPRTGKISSAFGTKK